MTQPDLPRAGRSARNTSANWPVFWALVAFLVAVPLLWFWLDPTPSGDGSPPSTVVVRSGEGWTETTSKLEQAGLVRQPLVFKGIVLLSGARGELRPGRYSIAKGTGSRDIISTLTDPENQATITVPEGWRVEQIGERLVEQGLATPRQWERAVASPPDLPMLAARPEGVGLEGYLFPETYVLTEENAAEEFVRRATTNLAERLTPELRAGLEAQGLTVHEGLTLASIIEREAQVAGERPLIASVFLNRLEEGMPLQADPTVQYAVGESGDWWKRGLTRADLRSPSPYNTYVHGGLPPGPIANPGIDSIAAVADPAESAYLYFVARGDGTHAFAETLEEHNNNVRQYLDR